MFDFITPQIFNMLVIANLLVGLGLIVYRFTRDMQRPVPTPEQQREQVYDEASSHALDDTASSAAAHNDVPPAQQKYNK
jgi:hypothetical protein